MTNFAETYKIFIDYVVFRLAFTNRRFNTIDLANCCSDIETVFRCRKPVNICRSASELRTFFHRFDHFFKWEGMDIELITEITEEDLKAVSRLSVIGLDSDYIDKINFVIDNQSLRKYG